MSIIVSVDGVKVILRKKQKVRLLQPSWGTWGQTPQDMGFEHEWVFLLLRMVTLPTTTGLFLNTTPNFHRKTLSLSSN